MSIRAKIIRKIFLKALILLAVALGLAAIFVYYQTFLENSKYGFWAIPVFVGVFAFITYKIRIVHLIADRDWEGEVKSVTTIVDYEPVTLYSSLGKRMPKQIPYTVVTVLKDSGKTVRLKIQAKYMHQSLFKIGDRIKHYKGASFPVVLTSKKNVFICPLCGGWFDDKNCPKCKIKY